MELAVYGKGGIGKSTLSANLSAALALRGEKVLQIGCDPKHDSTRLLMHETIPTVLDYLKETEREWENPEAVLKVGFQQIGCIEAGGPKPGVGCAGRGIISSFEFLERHHIKEQYDIVLYDVLGDVVCGGFAVPVRREYADAVFLVTSGEYMALYAANNILRGIRNFDGDKYRRVAGILYNERKVNDEEGRVHRFAEAVGLPICARVPRSDAFARAEENNATVVELGEDREESQVFFALADMVKNGLTLYPACPLTDEELEHVVLFGGDKESHGKKQEKKDRPEKKPGAETGETEGKEKTEESDIPWADLSKDRILPEAPSGEGAAFRAPLYGCAFNGAATTAIHLTDALVIAHSPRSCAFFTWQNISSSGRKNLFNRGILMPSAISPNFACSEMGHAEAVFGGMDSLKEYVKKALLCRPAAVVVISSCVSGIIGDDIRAIEELSTPEIPVIAVPADGDIAGDYMEGIRLCMHTLAERLIDPTVRPEGAKVNIVNETGVSNNLDLNYRIIRDLLREMDIEVQCRLPGDATVDELRHFLAAPLNILADDGEDGQELAAWLKEKYGCRFYDGGFPIGFQATSRFLTQLGREFACEEKAKALIAKEEKTCRERIEALKPALSGKKVLLTTINSNLDWLIETARAIGMEFVWIGVLNYLHMELNITSHPEYHIPIEEDVSWEIIHKKIKEYHPDIVLSNYTSVVEDGSYLLDSMPMTSVAGFFSAFHVFERWERMLTRQSQKKEEGWKHDEAFFEKYYA